MAEPFRVATYNVLADEHTHFLKGRGGWESIRLHVGWTPRRARLVERIAGLDADVVCLQEVSERDFETFFEPALAAKGYGAAFAKKLPRGALAARREGRDEREIPGSPDGCATFFRIARLQLVARDALAYTDDIGHVALVTVLALRGTEARVWVANTHLRWSEDERSQEAELSELLARVRRDPGRPWLLCGDFNADLSAGRCGRLVAEAGLAVVHPGAFTGVSDGEPLPLDAIVVSPELRVVAAEPIPDVGAGQPLPDAREPSDHLPITALLALSSGPRA